MILVQILWVLGKSPVLIQVRFTYGTNWETKFPASQKEEPRRRDALRGLALWLSYRIVAAVLVANRFADPIFFGCLGNQTLHPFLESRDGYCQRALDE